VNLLERRETNIGIWLALAPSADPGVYKILRTAYKRKNADEKLYTSKFLLPILRIFDCRCAICGADDDGLEMDHFWVPKDRGGNLMMKLRDGEAYVNNGIPTCGACNRAKSNGVADLPSVKLAEIIMKNRWATAVVNDVDVEVPAGIRDFEDGDEVLALSSESSLKMFAELYRDTKEPAHYDHLCLVISEYVVARPMSRRPWEGLR